jgi:magnesium transporter
MKEKNQESSPDEEEHASRAKHLRQEIQSRGLHAVAPLLVHESAATIAGLLTLLPDTAAAALLPTLEAERRTAILQSVPSVVRDRWIHNTRYRQDTVGYLMEPVVATFSPQSTVRDMVENLRRLVKHAFITYGYVVDDENRLLGVLVMRELLLAEPTRPARDLMIARPFSLNAMQRVRDVIPLVHIRHYSEYPVCDDEKQLLGLVRGYALFQEQTRELVAQHGKMVGIVREERLQSSPWRSLTFRHSWLQVNLLGSFVAAGVIGYYEEAVSQVVAIAAFIPVMVGQSASTGGQALAVALRGLTLGELEVDRWTALINKETMVGTANGALVGLTAALGMYGYATYHGHPDAVKLSVVMLLAMIVSTTVSSVVGAVTPFLMKRIGYDPATAATILVGGITRIVSIAAFLALARWIVL